MPAKKSVKLVGGRPWGFKIAGGYEVNQPIIITKVSIKRSMSSCDSNTLPKTHFLLFFPPFFRSNPAVKQNNPVSNKETS